MIHNSSQADLEKIEEILKIQDLKINFISVDLDNFKNKIKDGYSKANLLIWQIFTILY